MNEAFTIYCALIGFNLDDFDQWLEQLEDCPAKRELTERREMALHAFTSRTNDNGKVQVDLRTDEADDVKRHLEWLLLRRRMIETADVAGPAARMGAKHSDEQRDRINKRWADNKQVTDIVKRLATRPEYHEYEPRDLWPHLYARLQEMRLDPVDHGDTLPKSWYEYNGGRYTYGAFRRLVNRTRS